MQSANQIAPFLKLSTELRLLIYDHVWPAVDNIGLLLPGEAPDSRVNRSNIATKSALLRVCRTTCIEASSIFFARHAFVARITTNNWHYLPNWLRTFGPKHTSLIPSITVEFRLPTPIIQCIATQHFKICRLRDEQPVSEPPVPYQFNPLKWELAEKIRALQLEFMTTAKELAIALKEIPGLRISSFRTWADRLLNEELPFFNHATDRDSMIRMAHIGWICRTGQQSFIQELHSAQGDGKAGDGADEQGV
ncbi:hypothetical protein CBER1_06095 [Cercospora berteroae]|uniref:Uncharacterized protein n=1 Tax=Cercospora berteroae TaxID=357750 RepID=A0A2S6C5E7_9PEZI|nr:hypothetical protein CBER1_06095 [Cercospora berteroae]